MNFALLTHPEFKKHETPGHPERPGRLRAIDEVLEKANFGCPLTPFPARPATDEEILRCHRPEVLETVSELTAQGGGHIDPDTYVNAWSESAARLAVGGGIDLCNAVLAGDFDRGFVAARPPGHHATPTRSMGFCLFSTVAIVAKACSAQGKRVLVFDWDVHHGNGTQDCLYDHGGTCFVSIHQSPFYPGTGYPDERGVGDGEGSIYNIPLPAGCGDAEYLLCYDQIVRPIIQKYDPHLILVSAGFDAHKQDLLGSMRVTREGFRRLAERVSQDARETAAQGRLVGFLEGGYHLGGLAESVEATLQVWTEQESPDDAPIGRPDDLIKRRISELATRYELT
jgi:acetoin utilization deacetylase AcuC-like enzyme